MKITLPFLGLLLNFLTMSSSFAQGVPDKDTMYLTLDNERQVVSVLDSNAYDTLVCDEFVYSACLNIANDLLSPAVNSIDNLQADSSVAFYNTTAKRFQVAKVKYTFANHEAQIRYETRITKHGVSFQSTVHPIAKLIKTVDVLPKSSLQVGDKVCISGQVDDLLTSDEKCGWTIFNLFENGMVQLTRESAGTWMRKNVFRQGVFSGERILVKSESLQAE
jgi:hypothetical protein